MSETNLDLVRSIYADWERGDFSSTQWADPRIELVIAESLEGDALIGLSSAARGWRDWLSAWEGYRAFAEEYRALDEERVLVLGRMSGRGKTSGAGSETQTVNVFHIREEKVVRLTLYRNRPKAFAELGLQE